MKAVLCFFTCDHPFSTYEKFSEKLTLLTPWYALVFSAAGQSIYVGLFAVVSSARKSLYFEARAPSNEMFVF